MIGLALWRLEVLPEMSEDVIGVPLLLALVLLLLRLLDRLVEESHNSSCNTK